jgi:hypothetical protein
MTDGSFYDVAGSAFGSVYGGGSTTDCIMINSAGNVQRCVSANVLCEKKLARDVVMCVDKTTLPANVNLNASTSISISSLGQPNYVKSSVCVEYCRGTDSNQVERNDSFLHFYSNQKKEVSNTLIYFFSVCCHRRVYLYLCRQAAYGS